MLDRALSRAALGLVRVSRAARALRAACWSSTSRAGRRATTSSRACAGPRHARGGTRGDARSDGDGRARRGRRRGDEARSLAHGARQGLRGDHRARRRDGHARRRGARDRTRAARRRPRGGARRVARALGRPEAARGSRSGADAHRAGSSGVLGHPEGRRARVRRGAARRARRPRAARGPRAGGSRSSPAATIRLGSPSASRRTRATTCDRSARDLANALGTVGHLTSLRRTRSGCFTLDEALPLDTPADELAARVEHLARAAARALPVARLSETGARDARHGRAVQPVDIDAPVQGPCAWLDGHGALVAVGETVDGRGRVLRGFRE